MAAGICVIPDDPLTLGRTVAALSHCGLTTWVAGTAAVYSSEPNSAPTVCVVIDMPGQTGLELLETLRGNGARAPAVLIADVDTTLRPKRLADASVLDVLRRPLEIRELLAWIECVFVTNVFLDKQRKRRMQVRQA
jgi:DNA-binding response OmpR family regulator